MAAMDLSGNKKCVRCAPACRALPSGCRAAADTRRAEKPPSERGARIFARSTPPLTATLRRRYDPDLMPQMEANVEAQARWRRCVLCSVRRAALLPPTHP
jgi:hypothetical protein